MRRRRVLVFLSGAVIAALCISSTCKKDKPSWYKPSYRGARFLYKEKIEFDDGDTFLYEHKPFRILGIDCPETANPNVGIFEDQPFGRAAAESTEALIKRAKIVEYVQGGRDIYGRRLVHVFINGELLSVRLIRMGLAYETVSHFGNNGFPDLAQKILNASLESPKPSFQKPYLWRRKHQKKQ